MKKTGLMDLLSLKPIDELCFKNTASRENANKSLYGGQVLAQALLAAYRTVPSGAVHSLHAYFLRAGSSKFPLHYHVERLRDGRSISSRRVVAMQNDKVIFHLSASFHIDEAGFSHQDTAIQHVDMFVSGPPVDDDSGIKPSVAGSDIEVFGFDEDKFKTSEQYKPEMNFWFRVKPQLSTDIALHHAALAYISDMRLMPTAVLTHPTQLITPSLHLASIDHAIWFHEAQLSVNDWMFFTMHSPWTGNSRGLVQGHIYSRTGDLIATVTQEGLLRRKG